MFLLFKLTEYQDISFLVLLLMHLVQDMDQWQDSVNKVKVGNLKTS